MMSSVSGLAWQPLVAVWDVTRACDRGCLHPRKVHELGTSEALALVGQLVELRPRLVMLAGDDPLQRPGLEDLVAAAVGSGLRVGLALAVTPLLTARRLRRFAELGVARVALGLDGPDAATHDPGRGTGSFAATLAAIAAAQDAGLPLQLDTRLTLRTVATLARTATLVERIAPALWNVDVIVPSGRFRQEPVFGPDACERVFGFLCEWHRLYGVPVKTTSAPAFHRVWLQHRIARHERSAREWRPAVNDGRGMLFVSHAGDVQPSACLPLSTANVREDSLVDAYRRSRLFRALRDASRLEGKCGVCPFRSLCGGSRARAFAATGNFLAPDPACAYRRGTRSQPRIVR
jgi:radical SAM protein with 4Fe4S-binding SPASM domain